MWVLCSATPCLGFQLLLRIRNISGHHPLIAKLYENSPFLLNQFSLYFYFMKSNTVIDKVVQMFISVYLVIISYDICIS